MRKPLSEYKTWLMAFESDKKKKRDKSKIKVKYIFTRLLCSEMHKIAQNSSLNSIHRPVLIKSRLMVMNYPHTLVRLWNGKRPANLH